MHLEAKETHVDRERNCIIGDSGGWIDARDAYGHHGEQTFGALYRAIARDGLYDPHTGLLRSVRCVSKMYRDRKEGRPLHVGWVFHMRSTYEDTREPFTREIWVEVRACAD
jgi:hypothetical protein